ncbi:hypothetical protein [Streptomyces sp. NPDC000410]|uniref:hypothetical protein n=1 Tax=Streptomyces sp. NPDC000410 TaxID=3154254 RepID=UPI00331CE869
MSRHEGGHERERPEQEHGPEREHERPEQEHGPERERERDRVRGAEQYGPDGPLNDRTGNGIVNHGPLNDTHDDDGLGDGDELALRRMLQSAVGDLRPTEGALDHLRRAVPARRARKRQALVGLAASVILLGTAVPAFVHVASSGVLSEDRPVNAGHGEQAQGGTGSETGDDGGEKGTGSPSAKGSPTPGVPSTTHKPVPPGTGTGGETPGHPADPTASIPATTPLCQAEQLASSAQAAAPDAEGKVYGTFRVTNVSAGSCAITGIGTVGFATTGAADRDKISVVGHTTDDAATGLPDPSSTTDAMVLEPEHAYEVKFAFVPSETCPTTGASPDPTPTDGGATGVTDGTTSTDTEPQLATEDGGTADGSITVSHSPEAGAPTAETTIPNACAGTIYRTDVISAS